MPVEWNEQFMPELKAKVVVPALNASVIEAQRFAKAQMIAATPTVSVSQFGNVPSIRRGRRTVYRSSRPGGYPGKRTGNLHRSMTFAAASADQPILTASFGVYGGRIAVRHKQVTGTARGYGSYLEFGTRRMAARPYLRPTAAKADMSGAFTKTARNRYRQMTGGF